MKCNNPECDNKGHRISGLCKPCYMRFWRYGSYKDPKQYLRATINPSIQDINWAAGFLEGDGGFCHNSSKYKVEQVYACQVNREPLDKIRSLLGGSIRARKGRLGQNDFWLWQVNGARARGVMLTLYELLSQRRKNQIRESFGFEVIVH